MENKETSTSVERLRTNKKYLVKLSEIKIRVPKEDKENGIPDYRGKIQEFADSQNVSVNQLIIGLINEAMEKESFDCEIPNGMRALSKKE